MKIINAKSGGNKKYAIKFDEQNDWFSDDTNQNMRDYQSKKDDNFEMVNWEANQEELPVYEVGDMGEGGLDDILVDAIGEEPQEEVGVEPEQEIVDDTVEEGTEIDERTPDFKSTEEALGWAIKNKRVVEIFYVTQGKSRGRGGYILQREMGLTRDEEKGGIHIHRIVEPHYMFDAQNGNLILVTYDRSVKHIRAFIVKNIYQYNLTKNRKTGKDQYFKPRMRVMPSSEREIKTMENINDKLVKLASDLKEKGLEKSSVVVEGVIKTASKYKMAQYVGVQGYWLKNRRCWDNCYRQKRTSQPGTPAQEVWMECWDEYKDSINKSDSGWEKYASNNNWDIDDPDERSKRCMECGKETDSGELASHEGSCAECYSRRPGTQTSASVEHEWNKIFAGKVEEKVKQGSNRPVAIYDTIKDESQRYAQKIIEASSDLMTLADTLANNGYKEMGEQMAELSTEMLKEAQFAGGFWDKTKDFFRTKRGKIAERLNRLIQSINQIMVNIQGNVATAAASPVVKEAIGTLPSFPQPPSGNVPQTQPKPAMPVNLSPAQVSLYGQFLSDIRKEMGYLFKMQTKNPDLINITQPAIQSIGGFLTTSDQLFQATGKKTFNREQVMIALSNLLNGVSGAESSMSLVTEDTGDTEAPGDTGGVGGTGGVGDTSASAPAPTATAGGIAKAFIDAKSPVVGNILGGKMGTRDMDLLLRTFETYNLPLTSKNWVEFYKRLNVQV